MDENVKKLGIIVGISILIFWFFKPREDGSTGFSLFGGSKKRDQAKKPEVDQDAMQHEEIRVAYEALCAYIDAYNAGEKDEVLSRMQADFKDKLGIDIYQDTQGRFAARGTDGSDILAYS